LVKKAEKYNFKAKIYKVGINACVDVPNKITDKMEPKNGYIKINGKINGFDFNKNLVPVKDNPYRLFVNIPMLKGGNTELGKIADFVIAQDFNTQRKKYDKPKKLIDELKSKKLTSDFNDLTEARQYEILKYLNNIKTEKTLERNIDKLVGQLERKEKNVRIP
jgi:hypothetical protein